MISQHGNMFTVTMVTCWCFTILFLPVNMLISSKHSWVPLRLMGMSLVLQVVGQVIDQLNCGSDDRVRWKVKGSPVITIHTEGNRILFVLLYYRHSHKNLTLVVSTYTVFVHKLYGYHISIQNAANLQHMRRSVVWLWCSILSLLPTSFRAVVPGRTASTCTLLPT